MRLYRFPEGDPNAAGARSVLVDFGYALLLTTDMPDHEIRAMLSCSIPCSAFTGSPWERITQLCCAAHASVEPYLVWSDEEKLTWRPMTAPECTCPTLLLGHHQGCPYAERNKR